MLLEEDFVSSPYSSAKFYQLGVDYDAEIYDYRQ